MGNEKLRQFIDTLTEEEQLRYKDMIDEAMRRDRMIEEGNAVAQKSVQEYADTVRQLRNQMLLLQQSLLHLSEKLTELRETSQIVSRLYTQGPSEN